jgi:outer membrane protein
MKKLLFALAGLMGISVFGQQALSLSDAIQIGLARNYGILIERENVKSATVNNTWGEAGRLPSIDLTLNSQNNVRNQYTDGQFFGGQLFPGFTLNDQRSYILTPGIAVNWVIFQGNRAIINKQRLEALQAESEQNAEVVVANTIQAIILNYYLAVLEGKRLEELGKQLRLSADKYAYLKARYDLGAAVTTELLLEENNFLTDSVNYLNQQLAVRNAIRSLNILMVMDNLNQPWNFTDALNVEEQVYLLEDLQRSAMVENVDLQRIYLTQKVLELGIRQSRGSRMPTLTLNGGYNFSHTISDLTSADYSGPNQNYQNPPRPLIFETGSYFVNFTLAFNLFDGNRINRAIKTALINEDIGNLRVEQMKQSINADLLEAYDEYQLRRQLYEINKRRREAAQTNLNNTEERFKNGTINSFDYRDVQNNYLMAALQELSSIYALVDSKVTFMRLTNGLVNVGK